MAPDQEESTDGSSIRPVSSLRSHFENMLSSKEPTPIPSPYSTRQASPNRQQGFGTPGEAAPRLGGRISLDIPRSNGRRESPSHISDSDVAGPHTPNSKSSNGVPTSATKVRPISMGPLSPPKSPPVVTVQSPRSPPKLPNARIPDLPSSQSVSYTPPDPAGSRSGSPQANGPRHFRIPSRAATPSMEARQAPFLQSTTVANTPVDPRKPTASDTEPPSQGNLPSHGVPPPINRAAKPRIPSKASSTTSVADRGSLAPALGLEAHDERNSPFSTPPSSDESSKGGPSPPPLFEHMKPRSSRPTGSNDSYFGRSPARHPDVEHNIPADSASWTRQQNFKVPPLPTHVQASQPSSLPESRPGLPPRRETQSGVTRSESSRRPPDPPPPRQSMDGTPRSASIVSETNARFMPPPRRQTASTPASTDPTVARMAQAPVIPSSYPRASSERSRPSIERPRASGEAQRDEYSRNASVARYADDSDDTEQPVDRSARTLTDYPDSSQANRRPPVFRQRLREIPTKYETKLFAVCGEYVCTTGYVTRVWNLLTGEMLLSLVHGDTTKVTAIAFRPAKEVEDEGKRIWLGTNTGEIYEVDIERQGIVYTKSNAHPRREIIKIYRYASEMWSLDDEGKLHIWPADETGSPNLALTPESFRVPKGHSCSILAGTDLWIASGKEIRVFRRNFDSASGSFSQLLQQPLSQPNTGDITSCAIISRQHDRIYFGHTDGKITIYDRKHYTCLSIISVSLYKISSLVGVGDYLWAGYNTGMIYVYDTTSQPWKVLKDWHAHDNPIAGIVVDRSSIWKLDRLQVLSLGTDSMIRIWDGMLRDDWLETDMQEHDEDFCDFREITALVMTWNAGASKPSSLKHDDPAGYFFQDLLKPEDPPDILVFGFQELVDLENKKVTAKSFFKSNKKKDATVQEHMSHQYRDWRDHLAQKIDEVMPTTQSYELLHVANLVGLFTCVFVKSSERTKIRDVNAAEIKTGMGGLHGNKGALIVRILLDDSSLCFVNCHLAAGQTQTVHRNNDIATIMETMALPPERDADTCSDLFVSGGDGSMILDHEICILNGDLNYRIDTVPRDTVIREVKANNLGKLLDRDQLLLSRKKNPGFRLRAFQEAPITFAPTYKYDVGTDNYDTSEKKRSPAWCDRLLYRGRGRIKQLDYRRHEVRVSDHRPVSGRFRLRIKTISPHRRTQARASSEMRFEEVKNRITSDIKLDYLINVFGVSAKEAQKLSST